MIYVKFFLLYSFLGFVFESFIFKINNLNKHSGVLKGPYTLVYGIGGVICYYINTFSSNIILSYIIFTLICTFIEFIIGHLIRIIYKFDSWDYSYRKYHIGKYISLDLALFWGLLSTIIIKYFNNFFNQVLLLIQDKASFIILGIIIIDILFSFQIKK